MKKGLAGLFFLTTMVVVSLLFSTRAIAQQWTFGGGFGNNTTFVDAAQAITTDAAGNVYITGKFNTAINFGNGTPTLVANPTGTKTDGFVAKFNPAGLCQWATSFGGPGADLGGFGIATDGTLVFVTGGSAFPSIVDGLPPVIAAGGSTDGLVFALTATTGSGVWAKAFGGAPAGDRGQSLCLDNTGNLYISGVFFTRNTDATPAFFGGPGLFAHTVQGNMAQSTSDMFVGKIDRITGNFIWVSTGGAVASSSPLTIANDNVTGSGITYIPAGNELVVTGSFVNSNAVYTTPSPFSSIALINHGQADINVLELDATFGAFLFGTSAGGPNNEEGLGITKDAALSTYITGYFNSAATAGAINLTNTSGGTDDIFYAKYIPPIHAFVWSKNAGSTASDAGLGIASTPGGIVYVTGRYQGTVSFPTGAAPLTSTSAGFDDVFLVRVDGATGNAVLLAKGADAAGGDVSFGVATAGTNIWATGSFFGAPMTLTPSSPVLSITSSGDDDVFLGLFNDPPVIVDPTVFYSKSSGNLHDLATWGNNPDGSGPNPSDFNAGKTFNLANRAGVYTMTGNWTVGGTIVNPGSSELQINGFSLSEAAMTGTGTLTGSTTSSLTVTGTAGGNQDLKFTPGGQTLGNFMLNRTGVSSTATLQSPLEVYITLGANNGNLLTNGQLTLNSDALGTARVLPIPAVTSIGGPVTVERYIPARRAWRILCSTVWGGVLINQAWQEGTTNVSPTPNPFPGFGTHITGGPVFGSAANGFDQNPGAASSIKEYISATDSWSPLSGTNNHAVGLQAYMVFIRGDRGIALGPNNVPPTPTTLRAKGAIWIGDYTAIVSPVGFTAVPNVFASPIDFATIPKLNVQNSMWLWDPKMGGVNGVGAYVNVSFNGVTWDVTPASVSPESRFIQNGQGFLVKSIGGGATGQMILREADKTATPDMDVFRAAPNSSSLRINLQLVNSDGTTSLKDEIFSSYTTRYSDKVDQLDAEKLPNIEENLAITHDKDLLMVERRPLLQTEDAIELKIWNTQQKEYLFGFTPEHLSGNLNAWLVDKYLGKVTAIPVDQNSEVHFTITSDPASAATDRFKVVISAKKPVIESQLLTSKEIKVYPNPVMGRELNLQMGGVADGSYEVELTNGAGQLVMKKTITWKTGMNTVKLQLDKKLAKGIYQLHIKGSEDQTIKLVIN